MRSRELPNFNIGEGRKVSEGIVQSNTKTCVSTLLDETLKKNSLFNREYNGRA